MNKVVMSRLFPNNNVGSIDFIPVLMLFFMKIFFTAVLKSSLRELRRIFSSSTKTNVYAEYSGYGLDTSMIDAVDFMMPYDNNKCRVIEVWVKESRWTIWAHDWANGTWGPSPLTEEQIKEENYRRMANGIQAGYDKKDIAYIDYKPKVEDY